MTKQRIYSAYTGEAAALLGEQIRLGRRQRRWTEAELAERVGVSRATIQKIEKGSMGCALGLVLEAAALTGVPLFDSDNLPLSFHRDRTRDRLALIPTRVRGKGRKVHDDF